MEINMKSSLAFNKVLRHGLVLSALGLMAFTALAADPAVDVGNTVLDAKTVNEGLFPEDACADLATAGYKCMGFKPAVRFSLPAATFRLGSAELPEVLRQNLDIFAEVLKGKRGTAKAVRIEGHADATGSDAVNAALSLRRAEVVRDYLVSSGVDRSLLAVEGKGSKAPKVAKDPLAAENRRVEIGRQSPPLPP
jgi:outer membrane protein OmpA-like peptidoglycan-associated protein